MEKPLNARWEQVAQLVAIGGMEPSKAMLEAKYSPNTLRSRGPYIVRIPEVAARITALQNQMAGQYIEEVRKTLQEKLPSLIIDALDELERVMNKAEEDSQRRLAAMNILDLGEKILKMASPQRHEHAVGIIDFRALKAEREDKPEAIEIKVETKEEDNECD